MTAPTTSRGFSAEMLNRHIAERQEPDWMTERRLAAWQAYETIPMPTRQDEEWRRTDLRSLKLELVSPLSTTTTRPTKAILADRKELAGAMTFIDGQVAHLELYADLAHQGVIVTDMRTALQQHPALVETYFMTQAVPASDSKFAALHGAFWDNGLFVYVPKGVSVALPIGVIVDTQVPGHANLSHNLIIVERDADIRIVEELRGTDDGEQQFSSRVIELILGENATLDFVTVQRLGKTTYDFYTARAIQGRDSKLLLQTVELGAQVSKGRVETMLKGNGASARLLGVYLGDHNQHYDRFTLQDHTGVSTWSNLLYKGIMTDTARSVYSGFIRIHPGAKQSQAYQQNRNILLSRTARADSIPNLEINENDILGCTHGATVGKVNPDELFYLMCRGLSRTAATQMLVEGFIEELIAAVPLESMRDSLHDEISARIAATTANEQG